MKRSFWLLAFWLFLFTSAIFYCQLQAKPHTNHIDTVTITGKYVLSINQVKIRRVKDSVAYHAKGNFIIVPLTFTNQSADTLKYLNMSCSWEDIYKLHHLSMSIVRNVCEYNIVKVVKLAPHQKVNISLPIVITGNVNSHIGRFKIGMHLIKYNDVNQLFDYYKFQAALTNDKNLIWSNEVELP